MNIVKQKKGKKKGFRSNKRRGDNNFNKAISRISEADIGRTIPRIYHCSFLDFSIETYFP